MKRLFINAAIATVNEGNDVIHGALATCDDKITYIGKTPENIWAYDDVVDMRGKMLLPGFVNTHGHAAMTLLRGYADDLPLQKWLETKMWPVEEKFGPQQVKWGTNLALLEMVKSGTTTFADMYDYMDEVAQAVVLSGMRASLCRGMTGLGSEEERRYKLREATQFVQDWHGQAGGRITTMMAPHAPYTCPPDFIRQTVEQATALNVPVHIHMSETAREVEQNVADYGKRPVAHLLELGVFDRPTLVAHAVHVNDEEINILAQKEVKVSHNPGSNLKLGSGIAPIPTMLEKGLCPSLGTDSAASNNNLHMMEEMRLAALIHKGHWEDSLAVPAETALRMATRYGAEALFLTEIGSLEVGKKADFISVRTDGPHWQPVHDVVSNLVYSAMSSDVQDVYVNGRPLMRNRECLTLDEERIRYQVKKVWGQLDL
ncbi:amidohydrolase [Numidum massiliense]|uniref:amidohydrolase n=1 Tax=Numidum massiliense TaxID=1522315 RepID=UPI0006D58366|nr:amidohydrolase [Numidum massiliense]